MCFPRKRAGATACIKDSYYLIRAPLLIRVGLQTKPYPIKYLETDALSCCGSSLPVDAIALIKMSL